MTVPLSGARAARVFLCFAFGYLLSYALRAVNAVIAPALVAEMHLSNADLGLLSSAYFVSFGAMQLPLGVWLDKYGARRTEASLLLCAALGAAVFASSASLAGLWIGRALIGIGVSACLMAAFKAYRQWFPLERQSQLASWMLVAGTSGALTATVPVTLALPALGWRGIFWVVAALLLLVAGAIFFLLREVERQYQDGAGAARGTGVPAADGGYRRIFGSAYFWRMGVPGLLNHGIFFALQTLWAGPWMMTVLGRSAEQTGRILFAFNLVLLLSYLALGWAAPRLVARGWNTHRIIGIGIGGMVLAQAAMLATSAPSAWLLWLLLAACVPVTTLVQSHVALAFPAALAGRANSAYNLQLFIGAFATQWGFGVAVDLFKAHGAPAADAFRATLAIAVLLQAGALAFFLLNRAQAGKARP
ncbi:MFS transporter [Massilia antarctica]|uniref:MFS transporter n=1 Tax=Massilia antarctica TaxID=2765360 RepID=UPI0006BC571F|nr:MFS transporter [Massilia sp. H27-R4]CUI07257.1 Major facilitator family transporter [Janthinobacterium sp. CG23_2]CUU31043.1 Major facilitator family transporter [Janthinobacterium sp. CG23_2]